MKKIIPILLFFTIITGSGCAAQTKFTIKTSSGLEKSITCDNLKDLPYCKPAESLLGGKSPLRGKDLLLKGCPNPQKNPSLQISGRIVKEEIDASFYKVPGCQKDRWQKVAPLVKLLEKD